MSLQECNKKKVIDAIGTITEVVHGSKLMHNTAIKRWEAHYDISTHEVENNFTQARFSAQHKDNMKSLMHSTKDKS